MNVEFEDKLDEKLQKLPIASLDDLNSLHLLSRFDTKLIAGEISIPELIDILAENHKVLDISGNKMFKYSSSYYDTDDYLCYLAHHNGKKNRIKVRNRRYEDANLCFWEVKHKYNSSLTNKDRLNVDWKEKDDIASSSDFILNNADLDASKLNQKLLVEYRRITLINQAKKEKITIDLDIVFKTASVSYPLEGVSLIEMKHKSFCNHLSTQQIAKPLHIREIGSFSKYCMGLILTNQSVKFNRFKSQLLLLNKISGN